MEKIYYERNLPHWHPAGRILFVTWRLYGSLPAAVLARYNERKATDPDKAFAELDSVMDRADTGPKWLAQAEVAVTVVDAFRKGAEELRSYALFAHVIMPNHVHVLMQPNATVAKIMRGIKGATARRANACLGRTGERFWQDESYDHWVRDEVEFGRIHEYIEWNPVKSGLAKKPEDWPWSSAAKARA